MSTIEPDDVPQFPGSRAGRWLAGAFTIALVLAAVLAVYLEPYFFLGRVRDAVRADDETTLRALVDPDLIGPGLGPLLEAGRPGPGRVVERRYESPSRFLVTVRTGGRGGEADPTHVLSFVLERRGLSWWLADMRGPARWAIGDVPGPGPESAPGDSLPAFGEYLYVEELPEALERPAPAYPDEARRAGIEGTVTVQALVDREGVVRDARVVRGIPPLDEAALRAVRQWRFRPAKSNGRPIAVWVAVPIRFSLH